MQYSRLERALHDPGRSSSGPARSGDRATIRAAVARLADVRPLGLTVAEATESEAGGLRRVEYVLRHEERDGIRATLLLPVTDQPGVPGARRPAAPAARPAVLVSPGRNATLGRVTGADPPDHPDRNIAEHLARGGLVTLTLDYGLTPPGPNGGRPGVQDGGRAGGRDEAAVLGRAFDLCGRSLLSVLVEDATAALAWLAGRPEVDPDRIGLFGHSLGAAVALHTALLHEHPRPLCTASHLGSYPVLYGRVRSGDDGGALFGILRHADLPDLYGALAPAPLQLQYGQRDGYLDPTDSDAAGTAVRAAYAAAGAGDQVDVQALPMGHGTSVPHAVEFFTRTLAAARCERPTGAGVAVPAAHVHFDVPSRIEILDRVDAALVSGSLTLGRFGRRLEELAGARVGRPATAVSSGSAALEIAFRTIGVAGHTVLVPVNTFFATAASALRAGARVDFVDAELDGLGMDPGALRGALAARSDVAAVAVVHIGGVVSPALDDVVRACAEYGVPVVEDAAHALGSDRCGRAAGTFGRIGTFSLYPTKVATSGEGGIVTCADGEVEGAGRSDSQSDIDAVRRFRDHGKTSFEANVHGSLGSNWRMSELHAAVGIAHLERLDGILAERRSLAAWYDEHLHQVPGLRPYTVPDGVSSNYYKYLAFLPEGVDRGELRLRLRRDHGVALSGEVYDTLLSEQPYFTGTHGARRFPNAGWFARRHICLPLFPTMTRAQQRQVVRALRSELA